MTDVHEIGFDDERISLCIGTPSDAMWQISAIRVSAPSCSDLHRLETLVGRRFQDVMCIVWGIYPTGSDPEIYEDLFIRMAEIASERFDCPIVGLSSFGLSSNTEGRATWTSKSIARRLYVCGLTAWHPSAADVERAALMAEQLKEAKDTGALKHVVHMRRDAENPTRDNSDGIKMLRTWLRGLHMKLVGGWGQDTSQDRIAELLGEHPRGHEREFKVKS